MRAARGHGRRWALAMAVVAVVVLVATGFAARGRVLEEWWLHRLRQGDAVDEHELVGKLTARRCQRLVPILLERAPEHDVSVSNHGMTVTDGEQQEQVHWVDALRSPELTPGLLAVVSNPTYPARSRALALRHLKARHHPFESLIPRLLEVIEEPEQGEFALEVTGVLVETMPDDLPALLPRLYRAMISSSSLEMRSALGGILILWGLQLPDLARGRHRPEMEAGLLFLEAPSRLSGLFGDLLQQTSRYQAHPSRLAILQQLGQRLVAFLHACQRDDYPVLRERATRVLESLGLGRSVPPSEGDA